jgi:o-succinylbenzoate---CoA ligase
MAPGCGRTTVTKILNGGGGLPLHLVNAASQSFPRAAIFSAYGTAFSAS